jgi:hypothetical protein
MDTPPDGLVGKVVVGPALNGGGDADIRGVVDTSGECVTVRIEGAPEDNGFIWPNGTGWDSERGVVLPNGETLNDGDLVSGAGSSRSVHRDRSATPDLMAALIECGWDPGSETPWLQRTTE